MNDNVEAVVENTIEAAATDTDPAGSDTAEGIEAAAEQTGEAAEAVTQAEPAAEEAQDAQEAAEESEELIFTPIYNGVVEPIKASDTERVTTLLQKGMKFDRMADDLEKLHQLTESYGAKSTGEMLDLMLGAREKAQKDALVKQYGAEAGERMFELEKAQREAKRKSFRDTDAEADKASGEAVNARLAAEFGELQAEYPALGNIKELPKDVINTALQKGIPLLDAYNRYTLRQQKRAAAAVQKQTENQKASAGSLADAAAGGSDPVLEAFMAGVARAGKR